MEKSFIECSFKNDCLEQQTNQIPVVEIAWIKLMATLCKCFAYILTSPYLHAGGSHQASYDENSVKKLYSQKIGLIDDTSICSCRQQHAQMLIAGAINNVAPIFHLILALI